MNNVYPLLLHYWNKLRACLYINISIKNTSRLVGKIWQVITIAKHLWFMRWICTVMYQNMSPTSWTKCMLHSGHKIYKVSPTSWIDKMPLTLMTSERWFSDKKGEKHCSSWQLITQCLIRLWSVKPDSVHQMFWKIRCKRGATNIGGGGEESTKECFITGLQNCTHVGQIGHKWREFTGWNSDANKNSFCKHDISHQFDPLKYRRRPPSFFPSHCI